MPWPRVLIADDEVLLNAGLARLLTEAGMEVVGTVRSADRVVPAVLDLRPDVLVIDAQLPSRGVDDGLDAAGGVRGLDLGTAVLILSSSIDERYPLDLIGEDLAGVGYLLKSQVADVDSFLGALRRVADGGSALHPELVRRMVARRRSSLLNGLTQGEREVLALMAEGRSNTGIAAQLGLSAATVERRAAGVFEKLGLIAEPLAHRRVMAVLALLRAPVE